MASRSTGKSKNQLRKPAPSLFSQALDPRWLCALSVLLAALVYLRTAGFPFVYDDHGQILANARIQSWHYLPKYFTQHLWSQMGEDLPNNYYRPLFLVWFLLNFKLFGTAPAGWHVTSVLVHALVTLVVYLFAARTLKDRLAAGVAALIFAVHPIHAEAVAWVSGVDEPLFALFALLTVYGYLRWREDGQQGWLACSLGAYALSLLSKETAIVIPAMVLFYEWRGTRGQRFAPRARRTLLTVAPYLGLAAVYMVVRTLALRGVAPNVGNHATVGSVLLTLPETIWFYLVKLVWPSSLSVFYSLYFVTQPGVFNFWLPLLGILAVGTGLWWLARQEEGVAEAIAWMTIPMVPPLLALTRFDVRDLVHDRYLYLPLFGFAMIVAALVRKLKIGERKAGNIPVAQVVLVLGVTIALSAATVAQAQYWQSDQAIYERGVEIAPNNPLALDQLGRLMSVEHDYDHAREYFGRALRFDPDDYRVLMSYGVMLDYQHEYDNAIPVLRHATEVHPKAGMPYFFLGIAQLGAAQYPQAEFSFRKSIELVPGKARQHFALGQALEGEGRLSEARGEYMEELKVDPTSESAAAQLRSVDEQIMNQATGKAR
ncbi:MAG: glycosyltransferase family 39 protein [Acidobacteriota bacterium]|nr:glycosyltransferase family 39 protein [Acidobacteriota bacterium]